MSRRTPAARPRTDADDLAAALNARRHRESTDAAEKPAATPAATATPARPTAAPAVTAPPSMVRRSWYLPATAADELATAVDDLHFTTRHPKHEVLTAILRAGLDHLDDARTVLKG